eukprot:m.85300 g.85300  ORF g.85300 m.85300 type:complete len:557 (-) comp16362_c0_seq13:6770-8440(-)
MSQTASEADDLSEAKERYQEQSLEPTPADDDDLGAGPQNLPQPPTEEPVDSSAGEGTAKIQMDSEGFSLVDIMAQELPPIPSEEADVVIVNRNPYEEGGILKTRSPSPDGGSDARGDEDGDDTPTRKTSLVKFTLPEGHVDKSSRQRTKPSGGPGGMDASRKGMDLLDLQTRYLTVCKHLEITPLEQIVFPMQALLEQGGSTPPSLLDLSGVRSIDRSHVLTICEYIVQNASLREVNVSGLSLRDAHMEKLCQAFVFRRHIERLMMIDCARLGAVGLRYLSAFLARSVFLSYLNLSGCVLTPKCAEGLKEGLAKGKLRTLILHRCGLKNVKSLRAVVEGVRDCVSMSSLSLKSNDLDTKCAPHLTELLGLTCILETLDLRSNNLGDGGAQILAPCLSNNQRLVKLVLYDNNIGHAGAVDLFYELRKNTCLQSLDLSQNPIGSADTIDHLKRLLMGNRRLQNLFLWNVGMIDAGAIILGEGLAENNGLKRLEMRNNAVTCTGLLAISHGLKINETVYKVLIDVPNESNKDKQDLALSLYQAIQRSCGTNLLRSSQSP